MRNNPKKMGELACKFQLLIYELDSKRRVCLLYCKTMYILQL